MIYLDQIGGHDVWVTVEQPHVRQRDGSFKAADYYHSVFKFDRPPGPIVGEYLRESDGRLSKFLTPEQARDAAFNEAKRRIGAK